MKATFHTLIENIIFFSILVISTIYSANAIKNLARNLTIIIFIVIATATGSRSDAAKLENIDNLSEHQINIINTFSSFMTTSCQI